MEGNGERKRVFQTEQIAQRLRSERTKHKELQLDWSTKGERVKGISEAGLNKNIS